MARLDQGPKERRYADKYRARAEPIYLIAVEFSRESRNVVAFEVASTANPFDAWE